jgi:hypothetical protein
MTDPRVLSHLRRTGEGIETISDNVGVLAHNNAITMDHIEAIAAELGGIAFAQRRLADIEAYRQLAAWPVSDEQQAKAKILRERIMADIT